MLDEIYFSRFSRCQADIRSQMSSLIRIQDQSQFDSQRSKRLNNLSSKEQMEEPKSTVQNSYRWKVWHSINYGIGGVFFLIGSVLMFPNFSSSSTLSTLSAWLYTIGSFTFVLADSTECMHYTYDRCKFVQFLINFFVNVIGSFVYYVGSACFLPQINQFDLGYWLFIVGSIIIMIAQSWKLIRTFCFSDKSFSETYAVDPSGVLVDSLAGFGAIGYLVGSPFFLSATTAQSVLNYLGAAFYTAGGVSFTFSGIYMQKRYFWQQSPSPIRQELKE